MNKKIFKTFYTILLYIFILFISVLMWYLKVTFVFATDIDDIKKKIVPSPVIATIRKDGNVYLDDTCTKFLHKIYALDSVEILRDKNAFVYLVKSDIHNIKGWVKSDMLDIPETTLADKSYLKDKEIELYINDMGIDSDTNILLFTDIYRQTTYVLEGKQGNFHLIKRIPCSTGSNTSPTTRGIFKTGDKGEWFYSERFESGAMHWIRFNNSYLFHSVPMDKNRNIINEAIGEKCSHGCIRMGIYNIKWLYDNVEKGSTVLIN